MPIAKQRQVLVQALEASKFMAVLLEKVDDPRAQARVGSYWYSVLMGMEPVVTGAVVRAGQEQRREGEAAQ